MSKAFPQTSAVLFDSCTWVLAWWWRVHNGFLWEQSHDHHRLWLCGLLGQFQSLNYSAWRISPLNIFHVLFFWCHSSSVFKLTLWSLVRKLFTKDTTESRRGGSKTQERRKYFFKSPAKVFPFVCSKKTGQDRMDKLFFLFPFHALLFVLKFLEFRCVLMSV